MNDMNYLSIVSDILENEDFLKLKDINHHGDNRFEHSKRVSYLSYKITSILKLDYYKTARGALLHDFFFEEGKELGLSADRLKVLVNHPKKAVKNAKRNFTLSDKEIDIIKSHMFPVYIYAPRYIESWIVDIIDNLVAIYEKSNSIRFEYKQIVSLLTVMMFYIIK